MPVDVSVSQLEQYQGTNPRPADFDAYWETALAEMKATDSQVTFQRAAFQSPNAECWDLYFTGVDHARIYAKHIRPSGVKGKIPAVLKFHGYGGDSGEWTGLLPFVAAGFAVFALDVRGQGGKSEDTGGVKGPTQSGHIMRGMSDDDPQKLFYRNVFLDTAELADIVFGLDFVDETRVFSTGGSQGAALAIACAALEPRISRVAVYSPFLSDYRRVWNMGLAVAAYDDIRVYLRNFDPTHEHEDEIFTKLGYIDLQHLACRIRGDVLMLTGLSDNLCPPSTQYAIYNKLTCRKKHILYPDYGHEFMRGSDDRIFDFLVNGNF